MNNSSNHSTVVNSVYFEHKSQIKRIDKGKSLTFMPENYVIIDLETTGLDASYDEIIEFGALKVSNNSIIDSFSTLVNPGCEIDGFIENLTGITTEMLKDAPSLKKGLNDFLNFVDDNIIVAHNANFDVNFIYDTSMRILNKPFFNNFCDTMRFSQKLFSRKSNSLKNIANDFNLNHKPDHRALSDCYVVYDLYNFLSNYIQLNQINLENLFEKTYNKLKATDIVSNNANFNKMHPLFDKTCVFTGTLSKFKRKDAMQIVADLGGHNSDNITNETNFLIIGNLDYCTTLKDGKSSKHKKAESKILNGQDLSIISENVFYDMIFQK